MDYIILAAVVWIVAWKASYIWATLSFKELLEELGVSNDQLRQVAKNHGIVQMSPEEAPAEGDELPILEIRIEQHPEGLFAYRKEDNSFIAQGRDREGLMENLVNNLTNVRVIVHKEDGAELINPATE